LPSTASACGTIHGRRLAAGANTPWYVTKCRRGRGTSARNRSISTPGSSATAVVPSFDHVVLDAMGTGRFVGCSLLVRNHSRIWWGDWILRTRHLLAHGDAVPFAPFDRFAQQQRPKRTVGELLDEFAQARRRSLDELQALDLQPADLRRTGRHPEFGVVTLEQHLATWVAHDLTHVTQVARVMAKRYAAAVGPWRAYLRVLQER
jgi:hypothetical protein